VTSILVPVDTDSSLHMRAAYFALEFAKRTGAKVLFLNIRHGRTPELPEADAAARDDELERGLDRLINNSLIAGLQIETYVTNGNFVERVIEFAENHNVSRVILALPETDGPGGSEAATRLDVLQQKLSCGLVTVRPRHDAPGFPKRAS